MSNKALIIKQDLGLSQIGQVFAKSGYFEDAGDANKAIVKIMAGQELGIGPFAAMRGIIVNRGKLELNAGLVASLIKRHPHYDYRIREHDNKHCTVEFSEGGKKSGESTFSIQDAQTAGLTTGKNSHSWKKYPRNMLFSRALTNGARWYCPDVYGGSVYADDELGQSAQWEVVDEAVEKATMTTPTAEKWYQFAARACDELGYSHPSHVVATLQKETGQDVYWTATGEIIGEPAKLWAVLVAHQEAKETPAPESIDEQAITDILAGMTPEQRTAHEYTTPGGLVLGECGLTELADMKTWCEGNVENPAAQTMLKHVEVMLDYLMPPDGPPRA